MHRHRSPFARASRAARLHAGRTAARTGRAWAAASAGAIALAAVSGCASASARQPTLLTLDGAECQPLGPVQGTGSAGPTVLRDTQVYWARRDALGLATAKGATHVVLQQETQDPGHLTVLGYAYRCR